MSPNKFSGKFPAALQINWLLFVSFFAWTTGAKGKLDWWLNLNWQSCLIDLLALIRLEPIPAGSVWIFWLLASSVFTITYLTHRNTNPARVESIAPVDKRQLISNAEMMESRPELKEKILRLHESLEKI